MTARQINIIFRKDGSGTLSCEGTGEVPCLGSPETLYPSSVTNGGSEGEEKFPELYSNELDANISQAILLGWEHGLFIHCGPDNLDDNDGPTSGNIHLAEDNAKRLYDWIDGPVQISITKET